MFIFTAVKLRLGDPSEHTFADNSVVLLSPDHHQCKRAEVERVRDGTESFEYPECAPGISPPQQAPPEETEDCDSLGQQR